MSYNLLILEDDELFLDTLEDFLSESGFNITKALSPKEAIELSYKHKFDMFIFDINLPQISGLKLLKELKNGGVTTPTLFLSSRADINSIKEAFDIGAVEYLKKPIGLDELLIRVNAILKKFDNRLKIDANLEFDYDNLQIINENSKTQISKKEADLLLLLLKNRGKIVTKELILNELWSFEQEGSFGSLRVYINGIKKALNRDCITNIRGVGYRFEE